MADIFISYAKQDRAFAQRLAAALSEESWEIWWDPHLEPGEDFDEVIESELEAARCVVVLWSEHSRRSRYVKGEARYAMNLGKLVPALLQEEVQAPLDFHSIQAVRFHAWDGDTQDAEYQKLVRRIAGRIEATDTEENSSAVPSSPAGTLTLPSENKRVTPKKRPKQRPAADQPREPDHPSFAAPTAGKVLRDPLRDGGEGPEIVVIPAGSFWMGSPEEEPGRSKNEGPRHQVEIPRAFALGRTPVTFAEYDRFAEAVGKSKPGDEGWGRGSRPVINVDFNDAVAYADWLFGQTGKRYRLPTEAEWEYATRAGTETRWFFGEEEGELGRYAWFSGNSEGKTHPVGEKEANPWGLHDVHGNVWEWVQDCWHENYAGAPADGSAWLEVNKGSCGRRVARGGSWGSNPVALRSAFRGRLGAVYRSYGPLGFRLAQDL